MSVESERSVSEHIINGAVWRDLASCPVHTVVQLVSGDVVFICHKSADAICVDGPDGEHRDELPGALGRVLKLPTDLACDWIEAHREEMTQP